MVVERLAVLLHDQRLVDAGAVGVAGDNRVGTVQFEQDVFVVVDVSRCRCARIDDFFFYSSP